LRYIREIQAESNEHGFEIISNKGQGYRLIIRDKAAFQNYLSNSLAEHEKSDLNKLECQIARQLLLTDYIKLDDLAQQFNYSRSSISRITSAVASIFEGYNLELESKAHQGFSVQGSEINIRHCINNLIFNSFTMYQTARMLQVDDLDWNSFKKAATDIVKSRGLNFKQELLIQFMKYCYIAVNRIRNKRYVNFEQIKDLEFDIVSDESLTLMLELIQLICPEFEKTTESQWELYYLALAWEQSIYPVEKLHDPNPERIKFFLDIVEKAVENIKNYYGIDFTKDHQFLKDLAEHISICYWKYLLNVESENLYLDEVRSKYPTAYYYSVEIAACINESTKTKIPDDELSLITLHFAAKIERENRKQIKTIILCSTEFGITELLKSRLNKQYGDIDVIGICTCDNKVQLCHDNADFYISADQIEQSELNGKPILQLSPFLDEEDCHLLDEFIARLNTTVPLQSICEPNHFYILNKPAKKAHLLNYLCDYLLQEGRITEKEKADIFAREALVPTAIAPHVAMPHCIIQGSSFLVFAVLPKSIIWDQTRINLIILGCFHEGDNQIKNLLKQLYTVISNKQQVDKIIGCKSYDEFIKVMNDFVGEELC